MEDGTHTFTFSADSPLVRAIKVVAVKSQHPQMIWSSQLKKFRHAKKVFDVTYLDLHQENVSI